MTDKTRVALVTGGSKGIGFAIADALTGAGINVTLAARRGEQVRSAAGRLNLKQKGRALAITCDVRRPDQVRETVRRTVAEFGGLDILVNNAGVGGFGPVAELPVERWEQVIGTNLSGAFYCSREAIPHLRERGGGWIINMASLAGKNAMLHGAAYNASKFGLVGFSEALMLELRYDNIRVCYLMPGSVASHFNDHTPGEADAWKIQPEDIGRVVLDLLDMPARTMPSRIELRPSKPPR